MALPFDLLVVGAGPAGCVLAERAATVLNWRVLVIDRRNHLAGNCFDGPHTNGVWIHHYGPHYFRTRDRGVLRYLSQFTDWIPATYLVRSLARGELFPFPINLDTLEQFFRRSFSVAEAEAYLQAIRVPRTLRTSEDVVLNTVGQELYRTFFRDYTRKQWGCDASQLSAEVCGRIPLRFNRDPRYVDAPFQMMPTQGFTALFQRMLSHPRITVQLGVDYDSLRSQSVPVTVYCGPIDHYFDLCYGQLPYRSLQFEHVVLRRPRVQPCVQINYPDAQTPFTRSVEIKHISGQTHPETVVTFETPRGSGDPYYPVPCTASRALYERYRQRAEWETRTRQVYFCGRLAQYRYFNTDQIVREALSCFQLLRQRFAPHRLPLSATATSFENV
jgi:UDP-galactopyranose mutase